jgi:hypothetical protein
MTRIVAIAAILGSSAFALAGYAQECAVYGRATDRFVVKMIVMQGGVLKDMKSQDCAETSFINPSPGYHEIHCIAYRAVDR